ncbi:putative Spermine/spermidine synthase family protein [Bradyrhizobium sp. ORS 278]|uniref:spermine/spermidine synthase domain-containing protein n=1 Tax=Bradyrhizobium sp. (strain ORS 278) TaxID=114615 RepID=UPI00015081CE|nr:spermidine synthase [Bradyrhizobium sp. ORS 278]CAL79965.1 putative Spermine/spermidine synthase family protein [Bradyrhizobium sp. ORS 278]
MTEALDANPRAAELIKRTPDLRTSQASTIGQPPLKALQLLTAASGLAGLGYEIVWTRQLALALGTEMMAVLGAIAGFFAGLALGAFVLDRHIRQAPQAHRVYAILEAVIGVWGVCAIWLLPASARALAPLLGTSPSPVLLWTASFLLPTLVLLPATVAMGGTLTALERMMSAARGDGTVSAGVYGANTAGAVAGTLLSTFVLIPTLGLATTLLVLAAVNAACALIALRLGRSANAADPEPDQRRRMPGLRVTVTLFVTGILGIAFEVLVVRLAAQMMQDTVYSFACLLAAYLLGTALGGLIWQRVRLRLDVGTPGLLAAVALACLGTALLAPVMAGVADQITDYGVTGELGIALLLFLLPSMAMGALFGELMQQVRDINGSVGRAVGINSVGAAIAPLVAAQLLIPTCGSWLALVLVALAYLLLLQPNRAALRLAVVPALLGLALVWRPAPTLVKVPPGGKLLALREGPMATASVVDDASGARYLEVNGHFRMGGTSSARSDFRQAALPLLLHPSPRNALFLGVGTGATVLGGAQMPEVDIKAVELSAEVVALLPWFPNPAAKQPMPPVAVADARRFVVADDAHYDVIVADLFHPALDGSGALYTREHFDAVRRRLSDDGVFCQWLPLYQLDAPSLRVIIRSFLDVFPDGAAWLNHYSVRTPMLALIGSRAPKALDPDRLAVRLSDPRLRPLLGPLGLDQPIDLLGQYVAGPASLARFAGPGALNTDDFPFVTFDARRNVTALTAPPWELLLTVIGQAGTDATELLDSTQRAAWQQRLAAYWQARDRFIRAGASLSGEPRGAALIAAAAPGLLDAVRLSAEFEPAYTPLISMARSLLASDRAGAERLLEAIDAAAPSRRDARDLLSREFGR